MKARVLIASCLFAAPLLGIGFGAQARDDVAGADFKIPDHYKLGTNGCQAGIGYTFGADAPGHPSTYPKMILRVFNRKLVGFAFEVPPEAGWKPWYSQAEGKPVSHGGGPPHYSQSVAVGQPPTAEECAVSADPFGNVRSK